MLRAAVLHESISPSPPQILCVGIDWKRKTLIEAIHAIDIVPDQRRQHVRFVLGRAQDMPDWFAPGEIDEIWILHPEPSDRPQERAHRLVNANFLLSIAALLKIGGTIHIKTDHAGLYAWILGLFGIDAPAHFSNPAQDRNARDVDGRRLRVRQRDLLAEDDRSTCDDTLVRVLSIIGQSHDFWSDIERAGASAGVPAGHVLTRYMSGYEQRFVARGRPIYAISAQRADPARLCP